MKKWVLFDQVASGDLFTREINAANADEARDVVRREWRRMSAADRNRRAEFVAVIDDGPDPVCVEVIRVDDED